MVNASIPVAAWEGWYRLQGLNQIRLRIAAETLLLGGLAARDYLDITDEIFSILNKSSER